MKRFQLVTNDEVIELNSKTPREAALKAASRNFSDILLVEQTKIHIFQGNKRELKKEEQNSFTQTKNIQSKPIAKKMAYKRLDRFVDAKKDIDLEYIKETARELCGQSFNS
jgi:hypothetical protein